ncbi:MAG TPA: hypothetical protein VEA79_14025 [Phenylobacterium sp.]|nr:hypothetical protein [Phenylobacterium sp.]
MTTANPFPKSALAARRSHLFGHDEPLTGVECRILRTTLGLSRHAVGDFAGALGLTDGVPPSPLIASWEKSKGRGYPPALAKALLAVNVALQAYVNHLVSIASRMAKRSQTGETVVIRPPSGAAIQALMALARRSDGALFDPGDQPLQRLDPAEHGELWQGLADAGAGLALQRLRDTGLAVHVVQIEPEDLDDEPDGSIRPEQPSGSSRPKVP